VPAGVADGYLGRGLLLLAHPDLAESWPTMMSLASRADRGSAVGRSVMVTHARLIAAAIAVGLLLAPLVGQEQPARRVARVAILPLQTATGERRSTSRTSVRKASSRGQSKHPKQSSRECRRR
jgi:hypothetical protein